VILVGAQGSLGQTLVAQTGNGFVFGRFSFEFGDPHDENFEAQIYKKANN
jgi:hypothetical protein